MRLKMPDLILLPIEFYKKIGNSRITLYTGILFTGIIDVGFSYWNNRKHFEGDDLGRNLVWTLLLAIIFAVVTGVVDILFSSYPVYDIAKLIEKFKIRLAQNMEPGEKNIKNQENIAPVKFRNFFISSKPDIRPVIVMKIYIIANLILLPFNTVYNIFTEGVDTGSPIEVQSLAYYTMLLLALYFSAIINRGVCAVMNFSGSTRYKFFFVVYFWNFLVGLFISKLLDSQFIPLFIRLLNI